MRISNLSFCSSEHCFSPESLPKQDSGHDDQKACFMAWIVKNMNPKCLRRKNKKKKNKKQKQKKGTRHQQPEIVNLKGLITSEEWFPKSPTVEKDSNKNSEEAYGLKHRSGSTYVSHDSGEYNTVSLEELLNSSNYNSSVDTESVCFSDSRDFSTSLEKLMNDEKVELEEKGLYSLTRSRSVKEKKVSFRLPEVSDIIILNSPLVGSKE